MQQSIPLPKHYGITPEYGFLPQEFPALRLSDPYYVSWEKIISSLPQLISTKQIRERVKDLPLLSTSKLNAESEWQRAYSVLCFIAHGYIWSDDPPMERLPASISIPLLDICTHLGTPPVITYSALCLWNFRPLRNGSLSDPDNLVALNSFTGTNDESWFYINSVAVEAHGAPVIQHLLDAIEAVKKEDISRVTSSLKATSSIISELGPILLRTNEHLSPQIFYNDIRPFLAGSRNLPKGIIFEGSEKEEYHKYGGGSAAQNSLFQFCDIVLGVEHGEDNKAFVREIRKYMPACHRKFLEDVAAVANVKNFVQEHATDAELQAAFKSCYLSLKAFRDKHINIVTRYIVIPAKAAAKEISGTAGSQLVPFLKSMRDETKE